MITIIELDYYSIAIKYQLNLTLGSEFNDPMNMEFLFEN